VKGIADTGFLVAFGNRRDEFHAWAVSVADSAAEPLLTCDAILGEASFQLESVALVVAMVEEGLVQPEFDSRAHLDRIGRLAKKYGDRRPDFADLCLIRMSELHPRRPIVTVDTDFRVYRRNGRETIPVIMPPGR
jgi:predicted nucleic acid-binding protein